MTVPVLDKNKVPLMPCSEKRARKMMEKGDAKPYWKQGIFCIILQKEPSGRETQDVVIGIDPGSKRTGVTVATEKRIVFNLLLDTPSWVKGKVENRRTLRRGRRYRNTPYRKCRYNRKGRELPPSIKARWQAHLRVINVVRSLVPLTDVVIEDVAAVTKKCSRKWNAAFSPLEVGKKWLEDQVVNLGLKYHKYKGYETKNQREHRGFKKTSQKLANKWEAHNVDSHCLVEMYFGDIPPFKGLIKCEFLNYYRRQMRKVNLVKGEKIVPYGGTLSMGLKRGTLVNHKKWGKTIVGGSSKGRLSLHKVETNKRICQNVKVEDCAILTKLKWRPRFLPSLKEGVSTRNS